MIVVKNIRPTRCPKKWHPMQTSILLYTNRYRDLWGGGEGLWNSHHCHHLNPYYKSTTPSADILFQFCHIGTFMLSFLPSMPTISPYIMLLLIKAHGGKVWYYISCVDVLCICLFFTVTTHIYTTVFPHILQI